MNEKIKTILVGFSGEQDRSQLAPHRKLILELHRRGCSFRKIAPILSENFGVKVASTTISRFVLRIEKEEAKPRKTKPRKEKPVPIIPSAARTPTPAPVASNDEIRRRIAALKEKQTAPPGPDAKRFDYNPDQPLHLVQEEEKPESLYP